MTEPTPPPERPLPDQARARIRAELLAHAHEHRSATPRWLVPAGAAAAVALVAGPRLLGDQPRRLRDRRPAGHRRWDVERARDAGRRRSELGQRRHQHADASRHPSTDLRESEATMPPDSDDGSPGRHRFVRGGDGERPQGRHPGPPGRRHLVVLGQGRQVRALRRARRPDDGPPARCRSTPRDDVATYAVSTDLLKGQIIRAAGGIVPPGAEEVFDVAYTFPDGHTEHATKSTDDQGRTWWRMAYTYDDGGGNELEKPEIEVTMSLSGVQKDYTLAWGGTPAPRPTTAAELEPEVVRELLDQRGVVRLVVEHAPPHVAEQLQRDVAEQRRPGHQPADRVGLVELARRRTSGPARSRPARPRSPDGSARRGSGRPPGRRGGGRAAPWRHAWPRRWCPAARRTRGPVSRR